MSLKYLSVATVLALAVPSLASAVTFAGDSAQFRFLVGSSAFFDTTETITDTASEADFMPGGGGNLSADVTGTTIDFTFDLGTFSSLGAATTWEILGLDTDDGSVINGLTLVSGDASSVLGTAFTDNSVTVDFADVNAPPQVQTWSFAVSTNSVTAPMTPVPLPASLPLVLAGLGAFGVMRKRRKAA